MNKAKALLIALAALAASALFPALAPAVPPGDGRSYIAEVNEYVEQKFDFPGYFVKQNTAGRPLRVLMLGHDALMSVPYPIVLWGDVHGDFRENRYRYVGHSRLDESVTNPFFPPDRRGQGRLDQRDWIPYPWRDPAVRKAHPGKVKTSKLDEKSDPEIINRLRDGLVWAALCNGYDPPSKTSDLWKNPQKYVHIYLPPSPSVWGMGVIFRREAGAIWYVSVPLGPPLPEFGIELTPAERTGKPGDPVAFDLHAYCRDVEQRGNMTLGMRVTVRHQVGRNAYPVPFTLGGKESQVAEDGRSAYVDIWPAPFEASYDAVVTVRVQDVESKVVAEIYPLFVYLPGRLMPIFMSDQAEAKVKPLATCTDISVRLTRFPSGTRYVGDKTQLTATVARAKNGPKGAVKVKFKFGHQGSWQYFTLGQGQSRVFKSVVTHNRAGSATYSAEAWPVDVKDCNPSNNRASLSIPVEGQFMPPDEDDQMGVGIVSRR